MIGSAIDKMFDIISSAQKSAFQTIVDGELFALEFDFAAQYEVQTQQLSPFGPNVRSFYLFWT